MTHQIAVGTVILLLGVLALSWRLNNEPTSRPPVSQSPLTPGMGFVANETESEVETEVAVSETDEEASLASGERSLLLKHPSIYQHSSPTYTQSHKPNIDTLSISRLRRHGITESEEIWEELEDDRISEISPLQHRKSSAPPTSPLNLTVGGNSIDRTPNESTALLSRAGTGRNYRDKERRRSTHLAEASQHRRRKRSGSSQDALGGWWKMKHWWSKKGRRGKHGGDDQGNGNGVDDGV